MTALEGDLEVARQRDNHAAGDRVPVDHRDRRLGQGPQREHAVLRAAAEIADHLAALARPQIHSAAEKPAVAGDYHGAHGGVGARGVALLPKAPG